MDYKRLIDAEIWAFIRATEGFYPPDASSLGIEDQRAIYNRMCRHFFAGYPNGISVRDDTANDVPLRIYEGKDPKGTVIYFHGGGFVVGGLDSHDDVCAEICDQSQVRVVSVDYRLCPEHKHPCAILDAISVVNYVTLTWPKPHLLVGDSAGGNLAATAAHLTRGKSDFHGMVLIYPGLGGDRSHGSYQDHAQAPLLSLEDVEYYDQIRFDDQASRFDPIAYPLEDTDFSSLPPTVLITAECDPLADDGRSYCDEITSAGGKARWVNEQGLVHGFLRARHRSKKAEESFRRITLAIRELAVGVWHD